MSKAKKNYFSNHKVETLIFVLLMLLWIIFWGSSGFKSFSLCNKQRTAAHYTSEKERALAADTMKTAITGTLTATSIILAACAAVIGLYKERDSLKDDVKKNFKDASTFGLISILFAALALAYMPAMVNYVNVASSWLINLLSFLQLIFMAFSAFRLMIAVRKMI